MSNIWIREAVKILLYIMLQVFVLKEINLGDSRQQLINIIVYPVVLLTLPIKLPQFFLLLLAFGIGITIDMFYMSPECMPALACGWLLSGLFVLRLLEPKNGYPTDISPTIHDLGIVWFIQFAGILLLVFFFSYFTLQVFTFVYAGEIIIKSILGLLVSGIIIFLLQLFFSFRS